MKKEDYIKAIEKLNQEQIQFYYSYEYKQYRNKQIKKSLLKTKQFRKWLSFVLETNKPKHKRRKKESKIRDQARKTKQNMNEIKNILKLEEKKKVVYTCIAGEYDTPYPPLILTDNTRYILFSDNKNISNNLEVWEVRPIPEKIKKICHDNNILINRYIKMHPKELFPDAEYALYIDGNIRIISDIEDLFNRINDKTGIAMHIHPKREDVYEEAEACIKAKKGNKEKIKQQIKKYKQEGFPQGFGLFEAMVIASDLNNPASKKIFDIWWDEFISSETYRDQIIFTYILWKNNYKYEDIGILGENIITNPKFKRYMHKMESKNPF